MNAGGFAAAAAAMSMVGIIHAPGLHWPEINGITAGYMITAAFLLIYPRVHSRSCALMMSSQTQCESRPDLRNSP